MEIVARIARRTVALTALLMTTSFASAPAGSVAKIAPAGNAPAATLVSGSYTPTGTSTIVPSPAMQSGSAFESRTGSDLSFEVSGLSDMRSLSTMGSEQIGGIGSLKDIAFQYQTTAVEPVKVKALEMQNQRRSLWPRWPS